MTRTKYVFRQDAECLRYAALGDTSVRIIALHHIIKSHDLDAFIVPFPKPHLLPLWQAAFGTERIVSDAKQIPESHALARVSRPTSLDWMYGTAGWNVFESVMWENGFFDTGRMRIVPPIVFRAGHSSKSVMIYPAEGTDGNRIYGNEWWIETCGRLRQRGWGINLLGGEEHAALRPLYATVKFDRVFPATVSGLRDCVAASARAVGGSTGPTWALLMSDIPQVVLESKKSPHGYWFFDRCREVLAKRIEVIPTVEAVLPALAG